MQRSKAEQRHGAGRAIPWRVIVGLLWACALTAAAQGEKPPPRSEAERLFRLGDYVHALPLLESELANGRGYDVVFQCAATRYHLGDAEGAEPLLREALALKPDAGEPHFFLGAILDRRARDAWEDGRTEEARTLTLDAALAYGVALERGGDVRSLRDLRADLCVLRGDAPGALVEIDALLAALPDDSRALLRKAELHALLGASRVVLTTLERLPADVRKEAPAVALKLRALGHLDRRAEAATEFAVALRSDGVRRDPQVYAAFFEGLDRADAWDDLEAALSTAAAHDADNPLPWFQLGRVRARRRAWTAAEEAYRAATLREPLIPAAHINLVQVLRASGRPEAAEDAARRALDAAGDDFDVALEVLRSVQSIAERGDLPGAILLQEDVLGHHPFEPSLLRGYAILLKDAGRFDGAAKILANLALRDDLEPRVRAAYLNDLGLTHLGAKEPAEAAAAFAEAIQVYPRALDAIENWGVMLFDAGELAGARSKFSEVLDFNPARERSRYYAREIRRRNPGGSGD